MAYAFAERELVERHLEDDIELVTGGTDPADHVHPEVVEAMNSVGFDLANRTPREVTFEEVQRSDIVITMGCSADDVCPAGWAGENRDWNLDDPDDQSAEEVVRIRDEIEAHVSELFDEFEQELSERD
ncbi:low molecular weight phosphatase family protein [Halarchaeum sp. CBA1220]|uniref:arsenate reductase/protein-tyrosine-phosphatase family protein n=1 Tax=Halarchaeum sp. CBA1220 TaxID=1853682 RepID=UPI002103F78A|nr:low molecular weight phosphatase family protein [Halarchaeum sp. CBA1220]